MKSEVKRKVQSRAPCPARLLLLGARLLLIWKVDRVNEDEIAQKSNCAFRSMAR
jgi:hypothetical protein